MIRIWTSLDMMPILLLLMWTIFGVSYSKNTDTPLNNHSDKRMLFVFVWGLFFLAISLASALYVLNSPHETDGSVCISVAKPSPVFGLGASGPIKIYWKQQHIPSKVRLTKEIMIAKCAEKQISKIEFYSVELYFFNSFVTKVVLFIESWNYEKQTL